MSFREILDRACSVRMVNIENNNNNFFILGKQITLFLVNIEIQ